MRKLIVTLGGAGLLPWGPGTWGSLVTSALVLAAHWLVQWNPSDRLYGGWPWLGLMLGGVLLFSVLSVALGPWAVVHFARKDPGPFVLDEAAGICLTMFALPRLAGWGEAWVVLAAFIAFRAFDITKPPPCRQLERLPGGWGILVDDLAAAVYANVVCQLLLRLVIFPHLI